MIYLSTFPVLISAVQNVFMKQNFQLQMGLAQLKIRPNYLGPKAIPHLFYEAKVPTQDSYSIIQKYSHTIEN